MLDPTLFHLVFLGQILLISFYFPRKILSRISYVFKTYPPSEYPKLYPDPIEHYEKARRNYRNMNVFILLAGLALMAMLLGYSSSGEWDLGNIVFPYFMLQFFPLLLMEIWHSKYYKLMRNTDSRTTRKAELQPRRLFDFISPKMIGLAVLVYLAFGVFILYVRQFDYPWFGGYGNIIGVTAMNLFFAGIIIWQMYGRKQDPYQAYEDRKRQIELIVKQMVFISIAATTYIAIDVVLAILALPHLEPTVLSLYFQLIAVISLRALRLDTINFEVYKEDPSQESNEKERYMRREEKSDHSRPGIGLLLGLGLGLSFGAFIVIEGGTAKGFVMGAVIGMALGMVIGRLLDWRKGTSQTLQ